MTEQGCKPKTPMPMTPSIQQQIQTNARSDHNPFLAARVVQKCEYCGSVYHGFECPGCGSRCRQQ